jgi:hypothetical protein
VARRIDPSYLLALSSIAKYGAESGDPVEAHAATTILACDLPRGLESIGRPTHEPVAAVDGELLR